MNRIILQIWDVYLGEGTYSMTIYLYHATVHYPTFQALAERLALGLAVMHLTRLTREGDFDRSPLLRAVRPPGFCVEYWEAQGWTKRWSEQKVSGDLDITAPLGQNRDKFFYLTAA